MKHLLADPDPTTRDALATLAQRRAFDLLHSADGIRALRMSLEEDLDLVFSSENVGDPNTALVGATPEQLAGWGYDVTQVPSADDKIAECLALVAGSQFCCWAELDQLLMETIVPWIPYELRITARVFSSRVSEYSIDQAFVMPALDRVALAETGG